MDIIDLKAKVISLPDSAWEDCEHDRQNVKLTRPSHDAWGINKIIFQFCDDFLLKV